MVKTHSVKIDGGDEIHLILELDGQRILKHTWNITGSLELLEQAQKLKQQFTDSLSSIPVPKGTSAATIMLREVLLRAKNEWTEGSGDLEVCHCRKISEGVIERAIILGAHSIEKVRKRTSANTGCGACLPDVQALLDKRLG